MTERYSEGENHARAIANPHNDCGYGAKCLVVINRQNDEIAALRAELESLRPIHGAVSDYFMGARHREFSKLNGGQSALRKLAFRRMREYEKWMDENASEDCRDRC